LVALLAGAGWIWLTKAQPGSTSSGGIPAPQRGFQAPDFELIDTTGKTYRLSDLRGRPILLNFWASWCSPCKAEMPAMQQVYRQFQDQGFVVLAVNSTSQDSRNSALSFADQLGLSFPILWDDQGVVSDLYQIKALPSTFFIDQEGTIREIIIGGPMADALLRIRVNQLIEGSL
jgi:peroxiredoxin